MVRELSESYVDSLMIAMVSSYCDCFYANKADLAAWRIEAIGYQVAQQLSENPPIGFMLEKEQMKGFYFNQSPTKDIALTMVSMRVVPLGPIMQKLSLSPEKYVTARRFYIQTLDDRALSAGLWSMCMGSLSFDLDRNDSEQEDLNCCAASIPERSTDPILAGNVGALQDGSNPCPLKAIESKDPDESFVLSSGCFLQPRFFTSDWSDTNSIERVVAQCDEIWESIEINNVSPCHFYC